MGKYMKKTKITDEEVSQQSTNGVWTRAKTLALRKSPIPEESSYLQLRSRRLEKPPSAKPKGPCKETPSPSPGTKSSPRPSRLGTGSVTSGSVVGSCGSKMDAASEASPDNDAGVEASFGENVLEAEARNRNARETTPCSLIRDSETIGTPGSTTKPTKSTTTNRSIQNSTPSNMPTSIEMKAYFDEAERLQREKFAKKYNFDLVNDLPLPGRYEWVKVEDGKNSSSLHWTIPTSSLISAQGFSKEGAARSSSLL